jgi:uncharacterized membrane protein YtjA (UPF0391 family)
MLRAAIGFFVLALISFVLGMNNLAGMSMEIGRILISVFVVLAIISLIAGLVSGRRTPLP